MTSSVIAICPPYAAHDDAPWAPLEKVVVDESYANNGWRAADDVQRVDVPLDGSSLTQQ
ncbi:hypothetical protein F441_10563 [Phytophthora nicotianae CJ01A1]|uniref:Uncharacterized protein n=1 Tax=Phytophthora nicotianae CJ01A1 TaxID=1317063 RepID=W2WWF1_PHYNI|nr:hypothetical protein F441_10563 [Phytophthora nicotianae CJ01A1]